MATTLKSPGPGYRALQLSDGSSIWMPPEATADHWRTATQQGEAALNQKYMAQAAQQNSPVVTKGMVYSATAARPNTPYGHLMGWIDHNLGGNALNANPTAQAVNAYAAPIVGAGDRIATAAPDANPIIGGADMIGSGFNVGKHLLARAAPVVNDIPDYKTFPEMLQKVTGAPPLPADASPIQRIIENTAALATNPKTAIAAFPRAAGSYVGGTIGNLVAGEPGQYVGSIAGGGFPEIAGNLGLRTAKYFGGGEQGPDVAAAGQRQGIQPTAGMVGNKALRWFEKALGSVPVVGGPVKTAQERVANQLQSGQQEVADRVYGGTGVPTGSTQTSIGEDLLSGARQGQANITQKASDETAQNRADIGKNQPTNLRQVYQGAAQNQFSTDPGTYSGLKPYIDNLIDIAVQAQTPKFQAVNGPMPAGYGPFERVASARSAVGEALPAFTGLSKGMADDLYSRLTSTMRDAATAKDPALGVAFDIANENYQKMIAQREALEKIGGKPVGGYDQFTGPTAASPVGSAPFEGGKQGEGQAYDWFTGNLRSPSKLEPFADPRVVPNEYWRAVAGQWISQLGQTKEGTYRPEWMARDWNGPGTGVSEPVQTQLFTGPNGQPTSGVDTMNDLATLGRETVVPIERAGLSNTAGSVLAMKWLLDRMKDVGGPLLAGVGGRTIASGMESPTFVNAMSGNITPLTDALYQGVPAATQNVMQFQQNPPYQPSLMPPSQTPAPVPPNMNPPNTYNF
jgi:hypothetical protein